MRAPDRGRKLLADGADALCVHAAVVDANGEIVPDANPSVRLAVTGPGTLVMPGRMPAEAGIARAILRAGTVPGKIPDGRQTLAHPAFPFRVEIPPCR